MVGWTKTASDGTKTAIPIWQMGQWRRICDLWLTTSAFRTTQGLQNQGFAMGRPRDRGPTWLEEMELSEHVLDYRHALLNDLWGAFVSSILRS